MQILACGAYVGVPKLSCDGGQIKTFFEQLGRRGVPQPVAVTAPLDAGLFAELLYFMSKMAGIEAVS